MIMWGGSTAKDTLFGVVGVDLVVCLVVFLLVGFGNGGGGGIGSEPEIAVV